MSWQHDHEMIGATLTRAGAGTTFFVFRSLSQVFLYFGPDRPDHQISDHSVYEWNKAENGGKNEKDPLIGQCRVEKSNRICDDE